jgi:hypothetical protein
MGIIDEVLLKISSIKAMLDKIQKISISNKVALLVSLSVFGLCAVTNPSLNDYKIYEAKRFSQEYENNVCNDQHHHDNYYYNVTVETYKDICKSVVAYFINSPERLMSFIELNTERRNYFIFSLYKTKYHTIGGMIETRVKQHPAYKVKIFSQFAPVNVGVSGSGGEVLANGILGTFIDSRKGF